ncbi:DUF3293 domain-containing protein [Streptomyces argyrophyllae]|uniref:DUF3293 domain-containing protein n=1 Tax=Streptomyces argyrophylli TaxID=2726118 RepID=A0A6M4PK27_9ACTN|nr:DUF3293 domain-containing protein [Streptomyces argyrophyllae]QJS10443.1 DUF3293 domain-containing protein [Streptomyces argyrophyllae]
MHSSDAVGTPLNWDLYRTAVVGIRFGDRTLRIEPRPSGTVEGCFPAPARGATVHVITAWNPLGRTAPAGANARAQRLLLDDVRRRGLTWWPAEGGDVRGSHREESVAVVGLSDTAARDLGRRFGQDAVFAWTARDWRVLACATGAVAAGGWAVRRENLVRPSRAVYADPFRSAAAEGGPGGREVRGDWLS